LRGADWITVRRYEELISGKAGTVHFFYANAIESIEDVRILFNIAYLLNVKYFLSEESINTNSNFLTEVYENEIVIYRFNRYMDRAFLLYDYIVKPDRSAALSTIRNFKFNPKKTVLLEEEPEPAESSADAPIPKNKPVVKIASYEPDIVEIDVFSPKPGFLVLADTWFPGWKAFINDHQARIYRANYNLRAVSVPAGHSTVEFIYRPASFWMGVSLALMIILLLIYAVITAAKPGKIQKYFSGEI